jgi:hypothetical protein
MELIQDVWDVYVIEKRKLRVVFNEQLTESQAMEAYDNEEFEDIIDEETIDTLDIVEAK